MTKIIQRLRPSSRRLVRDIVSMCHKSCSTPEFQNTFRKELTGYGWKPEEITQALKEIDDIAVENLT